MLKMLNKMIFLITLLVLVTHSLNSDVIVRARLESCPSCKLNRLPEVRAFAYEDIQKYENAEFKKIYGASPELLFLNEEDEVVEKYPLDELTREQCNNLLRERGFKLKENKEL